MYSTGIHNKSTAHAYATEILNQPKQPLNAPKSTEKAAKSGQIVSFPRWEPAPDVSNRANHLGRFLLYPGRTIPDANGGPWAGHCLRSIGWMVAELQSTQWGGMSWSMRSTQRALSELQRAGYIDRVSRDKRRRPRPGRAPDRHRKGQAIRINRKKICSKVAEVDRQSGGSGPPQNGDLAEVDHPLITLKSNNQVRAERESLSGNNVAKELQGRHPEPPLPPSRLSAEENPRGEKKITSKEWNDKPLSNTEAREPHRQGSNIGPEKKPTADSIEAKLTAISQELGIEPHRGSRARQRRRWEIRDSLRDGFTAEELEAAVRAAADDGYAEREGLDLVKHAVANAERYAKRGAELQAAEQAEAAERERLKLFSRAQHCRERWREVKRADADAAVKTECEAKGHRWSQSHYSKHRRQYFTMCERCRDAGGWSDTAPERTDEPEPRQDAADPFAIVPKPKPTVEERRQRVRENMAKIHEQIAQIRGEAAGEGSGGGPSPITSDSVKPHAGGGVSTGGDQDGEISRRRENLDRQSHHNSKPPPESSQNVTVGQFTTEGAS